MKIASTRTLVIVLLVGLGLLATLPLPAETPAPKEPAAKPVEVTYFFLPGWPICAKVKPAVSGLEKEFPGKVVARNVDATTPDAKKEIKELGFANHGLVIRSAKGDVLFKQPDHNVKMDEVRKELTSLLK
jgi:hypothetical protein